MTPNEKREQLGLEPSDDPLMDEIYKPMGIESLSDMSEEDTAQKEFLDTVSSNGNKVRKIQL